MMASSEALKQEGNALYERYVKPLEARHTGEFIAVSPTGQVLLGTTMLDVAQRATDAFGRGNFIFKVGQRAVGRWR